MLVNLTIDNQLKRNLKAALAKSAGGLSRDCVVRIIERTLCTTDGFWYLPNFDLAERMRIETGKNIWVAGETTFKRFGIGGFVITFTSQRNVVCQQDIFLLQMLDLLECSKRMTTHELNTKLHIYREILMGFSSEDTKKLVQLSRSYQPYVRIVLAYLWASLGNRKLYLKLVETVNPLVFTKYIAKFEIGAELKTFE